MTLNREPGIAKDQIFIAEGDEFTQRSADGQILAHYKTPDIYRKHIFLQPSRLNITPISINDLVEITYNNEAWSGYVRELDTYICIEYTGRKKRFRIDDCQFIKRII